MDILNGLGPGQYRVVKDGLSSNAVRVPIIIALLEARNRCTKTRVSEVEKVTDVPSIWAMNPS